MSALDFSEILGLVKTKTLSYVFLDVLEELSSKTFIEKKSDNSDVNDLVRKEVTSKLAHFLNSKNTFANKEFERETIEKLKKVLKTTNVLTLRCAIKPNDPFISELYTWFKSFGLKNFLLDFEMADNIYGGFQLVWGGKVLDLSLKSKIAEYVESLVPSK